MERTKETEGRMMRKTILLGSEIRIGGHEYVPQGRDYVRKVTW